MLSPKDAQKITREALKMGYRQLEKALRDGKARSIGISNFEGKNIEELEKNGRFPLSSFRWKPIHILRRRICA